MRSGDWDLVPDPYRIPRPALISFSGGRTSGRMLKGIIDAYHGKLPDDIVVAFCNTGKEHNKTLDFVHECDTRWNANVHWLEFDPSQPDSTREVSYATASRDGEPLKAAVDTRPTAHLFNPVSRYCSVTTKARRMQKLMLRLGHQHWYAAIGLRADEPTRVEKARKRAGRDRQTPVMPLADAGETKADVTAFWAAQPFDLMLPNMAGVTPLGNCVLCPLKARAKLINALRVMPHEAQWWIDREDEMTARTATVPYKSTPVPVYERANDDDLDSDLKLVGYREPSSDRRSRFHKDGTSYRNLLAEAERLNSINAPMDQGYDVGIDCLCTD